MNQLLFVLIGIGLSLVLVANKSFAGPIADQAKEFGASRCIKEIESLDNYLNKKANKNGAWSSAAKKEPNKRIYTSLNVRKYNDGTWGYANITIVPSLDNKCDATLTQLITFPNKSCNTIRETIYKKYKYYGEVAGKALYKKGTTKLVLEDLTGSCVIMKVEVLFPSPKAPSKKSTGKKVSK